jgi:hypothetical protein
LMHLFDATQMVNSDDARFPSDLAALHATKRAKSLWTLLSGSSTAPPNAAEYLHDNANDVVARLDIKTIQFSLSSVVSSRLYDVTMREVITTFEPQVVPYYLARFLSGSCREAALWSMVIPTEPLFCISPSKYSHLLAYQLGCALPNSRRWPTSCECGAALRLDPLHVFGCERRYPHDRVKIQLSRFCQAAGLVPTLEPLNTCHGSCRPDIAIPDLDADGKTVLVDFTSADPGAVSHLNLGSSKSYHVAAQRAEQLKISKYQGNFDPAGYVFCPLAMEVPGRWSKGLFRFFGQVKRYARLNRIQDSLRHSSWVEHWRKVFCVVYRVSQVICVESLSHSLLSGESMAIIDDPAV